MQTEEPPEFRFTKEVMAIVLITLIALALPLAGVIFALKGVFHRPQQPLADLPAAATAPLRNSLERAAEKDLPAISLGGGPSVIHLEAADPAQELTRVQKLVENLQGSILPTSSGTDGAHFLVQIATNNAQTFAALCAGQGNPPSAVIGDAGAKSALIEVIIAKKAP